MRASSATTYSLTAFVRYVPPSPTKLSTKVASLFS